MSRTNPTAATAFCALVAVLAGGDVPRGTPLQIDGQWFRHGVLVHHLSKVLAAAPTPSGAFRTRFTRDWQPKAGNVVSATMQARVLYALAAGHDLTGDARYFAELRRGADFLLGALLDQDSGGSYEAVAFDGTVVKPHKRLYSQAFALFGLAHAYRVTHDRRYLDAALGIWKRVRFLVRDGGGGFVADTDRLFAQASATRDQNPIMHLFEALLALYDATADPQWLRDARDVSDFILTRLLREAPTGRYIAEYHDAQWQRLPAAKGGYVDLGHQAEWAWLLSAGAERGLPAYYVDIGGKLLAFAVASGYDRERGGLFWRVDDTGAVNRRKIWWVQSEFLRATMRYVIRHGRSDLRAPFEATLAFVRDEFLDEGNGGWYASPKTECARSACGDEQPDVGYHIVAMHMEALALAGARPCE